jgi:hypothetical protein
MAKRTSSRTAVRTRPDGRKSLYVYLRPDVIKRLKVAALDQGRTAYEITEEAISAWLSECGWAKKRKSKKR